MNSEHRAFTLHLNLNYRHRDLTVYTFDFFLTQAKLNGFSETAAIHMADYYGCSLLVSYEGPTINDDFGLAANVGMLRSIPTGAESNAIIGPAGYLQHLATQSLIPMERHKVPMWDFLDHYTPGVGPRSPGARVREQFALDKNGHTYARLLAVQARQLQEWKTILKRKAFSTVRKSSLLDNKPAADPTTAHRVMRGDELASLIGIVAQSSDDTLTADC
jgi:hypothetical protein